jgi:hypothetical protein
MPSRPEQHAHLILSLFRRRSPEGQPFNRLRRVGDLPNRPSGGMERLGTPTGPRTHPRRGHV